MSLSIRTLQDIGNAETMKSDSKQVRMHAVKTRLHEGGATVVAPWNRWVSKMTVNEHFGDKTMRNGFSTHAEVCQCVKMRIRSRVGSQDHRAAGEKVGRRACWHVQQDSGKRRKSLGLQNWPRCWPNMAEQLHKRWHGSRHLTHWPEEV